MDEVDISAGHRRSPAKHRAILQAAIEVFLREGYSRASVDAIAAVAGVGKQTVYGHFGSKERLFLAAVEAARQAGGSGAEEQEPPSEGSGDVVGYLTPIGTRVLNSILSPEVAALHRLTIAELTHHPELQRSWRGSEAAQEASKAIAGYLAERDRAGELSVPDPGRAARQFVRLVATEARVRSLYGTQPLTGEERTAIAREAAELIVRAHSHCPECGS
ncbi:TetR family transcriptional regulator [Spongiactinospora rosea]|uniref:TetR family transcriptional regulator n=1 Tax=Spongiactinospora rosea TaxID=2248750 RepID=A0A366M1I9_9ACTN|nr:TetR/AcrR family transcriptional regulator [Spongiactinospora rosea]RBQ20078.1 TetR family transcriptional regulator [Spongiactinospora rosea]